MKIIILRDNLKKGLDIVGRSVGSQLNLPVLGNILLSVSGNNIYLSTTNLELAITKTVFGKVVEEGGITVPFSTLSGIINNITSERIHLEKTKEGGLELKTDNYQAKIQGIEEKDFPIIPQVEKGDEYMEINSIALKDSLGKTVIAGEVSEFRPEISGIFFSGDTTTLKLVATDSFRLAESIIMGGSFKNTFKESVKITIPLKTTQELLRILPDDGVIRVYLDKNQVLFETEALAVISRLIEGDFPNYKAIIPTETNTEVIVNREELINALKLTSSFASKTSDVRIRVKDKKIIEIYSSDNSIGENNYIISAKISGKPVEIVFNWRYFLDGVRVGVTEDVFLGINDGSQPVLIKTPKDEMSFYILMPVRST